VSLYVMTAISTKVLEKHRMSMTKEKKNKHNLMVSQQSGMKSIPG